MKALYTGLTVTVIALSLSACTKKEAKEQQVTENEVTGEKIRFGILPSESAIPIILAKEKGFFEEEGTEVEIEAFSSPNDRNVAIQAKTVEGTISDVMTEATFKKNGTDMTITSGILEDFKILASQQSGITEMKELDGKKITLVPNFILEYIMDEFADEEDFTYEVVDIPSFATRSEALLKGEVDAAVYTEPQASMLTAQGAVVLGSSKEAGINGGAIQFADALLSQRPQDVTAFYKAYNKAIDYMNGHSASDYADILSQYAFPEAMSDYLDRQETSYPYAQKIGQEQYEDIIGWTLDKGQIEQRYTYEELTDYTYIDR